MIRGEVKLLKGSKARDAADEAGCGSGNGPDAEKQSDPDANRDAGCGAEWPNERRKRLAKRAK